MTEKNNMQTDEILSAVRARADEILEEWTGQKATARAVVREVERAIKKRAAERNLSNSKEALAYIYALELRITKLYSGLISVLFRYFSMRREKAALRRFRFSIDPSAPSSIEALIICEIEGIRELSPGEELQDEQAHGGRSQSKGEEASQNGKAHEEQEAKGEKNADEAEVEAEEAETEGEPSEESAELQSKSENEITETIGGQSPEPQISDGGVTEGGADETMQEVGKPNKIEKEGNTPEEASEKSIDLPDKNVQNNAEDMPPQADTPSQKSQERRISFIGEVILDGMVLEGGDAAGRIDNKAPTDQKPVDAEDAHTVRSEDRSEDREAYVYDRADRKEEGNGVNEMKQGGGKASVKEDAERIDLSSSLEDAERVNLYPPVEKTVSLSEENAMRLEINDQLSQNEAAILLIKEAQEATLKALMEDKTPITVNEAGNNFAVPELKSNDSPERVPEIKNEVKL